ncbi:MAG TPA: lipid-A-disaccharide synthase [Candidatus Polarisedimenticolia bacterium]|nr:lipid-A-disaccharide synthase [Candidatus Polarisedimenticolia bacterium]
MVSTTGASASVLIVAGEASGDLYGGLLMRAMGAAGALPAGYAGPPRFLGIGGPAMRAAGLAPLGDAGVMGVTGLLEVLGSLRVIWRAYREACRALERPHGRPDLVLLIDYPDFNLRLARRAKKAGVPVLYFVSPQIWAWRKGRVRQIAGVVDRMLVILPFEEEIYRRAGVPVEFVGHPLLDLVRPERDRRQTLAPLGLDPRRTTVALLPGSRHNELRAHLPPMLAAAGILKREFRDLQFVLPVAPTLGREEVERIVRDLAADDPTLIRPVLVVDGSYDAVGAADAAIVASGTATLETALLGVPMVIVYRMNPLTYALARLASDVPHVGMANLIAGERLVPELVQGDCRGAAIARELRRILTDPAAAESMRRGLAGVRARLGRPGAIGRAAAAAWDMIGAARGARVA